MTRSVFVSVEATGLDTRTCRIVEIVALEALGSHLTGIQFHVLLDPRHPIEVDAETCIDYNNASLAGLPTFKDVRPAFLKFLQGADLVTLSPRWSYTLINAELARLNISPLAQNVQELWDVQAEAKRRGLNIRLTVDDLAKHFDCREPVQLCSQTWRDCFMLAQIFPHLVERRRPKSL